MFHPLHRPEERRRRGVVAAVVALSLVALLSVVALTADGGQALAERRNAQGAADAAAWSAAADLFANWQANNGFDAGGTAVSNAQAVAAVQGYGNSNVTVNVPGGTFQGGPHQGTTIPPGYAEVIISYNQPAYFSSVFGSNGLTISARSVVRSQWVWAPPIVVLDQTLPGALDLGGGSYRVLVPNGPVFVNSSDAQAMQQISGAVMLAPQYNVVGGATAGFNYYSNPNYPASGFLRTGTRPVPDPLSLIPAINSATLPVRSVTASVTGVYNLSPGYYASGLSFSGSDSVNMAQGVYYVGSTGFSFRPSGTTPGVLNAPSVMIYSTGPVRIDGTGAVTLGPLPSTFGLNQGITIFMDRASNQPIRISHVLQASPWNITGAIYGANSSVLIGNQGGDPSFGSQFICRYLTFAINNDMTVPGNYVLSRSVSGVE